MCINQALFVVLNSKGTLCGDTMNDLARAGQSNEMVGHMQISLKFVDLTSLRQACSRELNPYNALFVVVCSYRKMSARPFHCTDRRKLSLILNTVLNPNPNPKVCLERYGWIFCHI